MRAEPRVQAGPQAAGEVQSTVLLSSADSTLNAWYPSQVFGTDGSLELRSGGISRPVLKFDVSDIVFTHYLCVQGDPARVRQVAQQPVHHVGHGLCDHASMDIVSGQLAAGGCRYSVAAAWWQRRRGPLGAAGRVGGSSRE